VNCRRIDVGGVFFLNYLNRFEFKWAGRAVTARYLHGEVLFVRRMVGRWPEFKLDVRELFFSLTSTTPAAATNVI
jgi:hypothetical protein